MKTNMIDYTDFTTKEVENNYFQEYYVLQHNPPPVFYHRFEGAIAYNELSSEKITELILKAASQLDITGIDIQSALEVFTKNISRETCNRKYRLEGTAGFLFLVTWDKLLSPRAKDRTEGIGIYVSYLPRRRFNSYEDVPYEELTPGITVIA